ncbi:hypothetical protein PE067_18150 [Paracoccus sp. DMF-8]|uniref:hypothetical protein n=1 Tax=Paracoccus sp. DMF-8 TaxID=3019445 RepID=UPI0023E43289|nr:hypothetical protein [Paracoccus sp. DMF-8]MDF3607892.1 hypothetical protein [Paracoccus sp. DMF-8]
MALPVVTFSLTACSMRPSGAMTRTLPDRASSSEISPLSSLGATPVDRTKVYRPPQDDEDDPFAFLDAPAQ